MADKQVETGTQQFEAGFYYEGPFYSQSSLDNLTANSGGLFAGATMMGSMYNRVTTVAALGDSVKLPIARPGRAVSLANSGANPMRVYSQGTDTINGISGVT